MDAKAIFEKEISKLKEDKNIIAILIVGSLKDLNFDKQINDIDLFVITKEGEKQIREIKYIEDIEFDINYFSIDLVNKLINLKEQFFLEGMNGSNLIYDTDNIGEDYLRKSNLIYKNGPDNLDIQEIINLKFILLDNIKRIKNLQDNDWREVEFLSSLYLKDTLKAYFTVNKKWIPKDKKLFKVLKEDNKELYDMSQKLYINYNPEVLESIVYYIFKDIKESKDVKIIY